MSVTSAIRTVAVERRLTEGRIGEAQSLSEIAPAAVWYRSGWNRWWFLRSMSVTSTSACRSFFAAASPPDPPPTSPPRRGGFPFASGGTGGLSLIVPRVQPLEQVIADAQGVR